MSKISREDVKSYLESQDEIAVAEILYEVFCQRRDDKHYEGGDFQYDDVMCLALCSFGSSNGELDESSIVELYAPIIVDEAEKESCLCEQGVCPQCKAELISSGKVAKCPICNTKAFLT